MVGALPSPADDILRIDHQGKGFLAILNALLALCDQAPHLSAGNIESAIELHASPQLPLAKDIAVALAVVGGHAGAEEIALVIGAHFGAGNFALS